MTGTTPLIHVGYPKALSSWLQKHLFQPGCGFYTALDPVRLQLALIEPGPFAFETAQLEAWMREAAQANSADGLVPVITSESLVGNPFGGGFNARTNADRLHTLCQGEARVLIICREQRAAIRSLYKTLVYWGLPHTIERLLAPVDRHLIPQFSAEFFYYDALVAYYQARFGRQRVLALPYEAFAQRPQQFLRRIARFAGLKPDEEAFNRLPCRRRVNVNQPLSRILLQRWRNQWLLASPFNYSGLLRSSPERLQRRLRRGGSPARPLPWDGWLEDRFMARLEAAVSGEFADSNRRLQELAGLSLEQYGYQL